MPRHDPPADSSRERQVPPAKRREPPEARPAASPRGRTPAHSQRGPESTAFPLREESEEGYTVRPRPDARLQILILEERDDSLHHAVRALTTAGHTPRTVQDEELAATEILAGENTHFLLLTAYPTRRPLSIPQLLERLRQGRYGRTISYCAKGRLSPETRMAYEALAVGQVLGLPVRAQRSILTALAWLAGQVSFEAEGLTVLECV